SGLAGSTGDLAARHGAPPETVAELARPEPRHPFIPFADPPDVEVSDGDRLDLGDGRFLEVLHTPGHEQAHICLRDSRTGILFSGDHVLPGITPVVMYDEMVADALGEYISSLTRIRDLGAGATYPAHGTLMQHGSARAAQIILHHQRRLAVMSEEVRIDPKTAWAVMSKVFRPHLNMWEQRLALRETIAHLEHLRLNRRLGWSEQQGVVWYRRDAANPAVMAP
ncbi:MAG: MBL fold metallo-hydrolase, partial [Acidimicrobiia bacterium]